MSGKVLVVGDVMTDVIVVPEGPIVKGSDRRAAQLFEVRRNVERLLGAAMHAANAAGGKDMDAGECGDLHGGGDGGAGNGALDQQRRNVAPAGLGGLAALERQPLQVLARHADAEAAIHDGDGGGHRAMGAHHILDLARHGEVLRIGHAMGDDGRFQRHDGLACGQRLLHFGTDGQIGLCAHGSLACRTGRTGRRGPCCRGFCAMRQQGVNSRRFFHQECLSPQ